MFDSKSQLSSQDSQLRILKPTGCTLNGRFLTFSMKNLKDGPSNNRFFIAQSEHKVKKDKNNNFEPSLDSNLFLSVQAFGVASLVDDMYERDMQDLKDLYQNKSERFNKASRNWANRSKIGIFLEDEPDESVAYYSPTQRELRFTPFLDDESNKLIHSSELFDIIAHETGHSILDSLRPEFEKNDRQQTKGLHESFGDCTILFTILCRPELREELLKVTGGDLHKKSFFSIIAEEFHHRKGLRNADNNLKISQVGCEEHDLSEVFTGAIYDILAKSFNKLQRMYKTVSQDLLLAKVNKDLRHLFLRAFIEVLFSNPSFSDIGHMMEVLSQDVPSLGYIHDFIQEAFSKRGIDISGAHKEFDLCDIKQRPKTIPDSVSRLDSPPSFWRSKKDDLDNDLSSQFYSQLKVKDSFKHDKGKYLDKKPNLQQRQSTKVEHSDDDNDDDLSGDLHYDMSDPSFLKQRPIPLGRRPKAKDDLGGSFQQKSSLKQDQSKRKGNNPSRPLM